MRSDSSEPARARAEPTTVDRAEDLGARRRWMAFSVLSLGFLMIVLDKTIVDVALPTIQRDLGFSVTGLAWVVNAYLLAFGGLLLLAGRLGDLIGRRRIFLAGLAAFTSASLVAGLADSPGVLIAARFIQGVGGAMSSAVILGMIVTMFPKPAEQARAMGIYAFVASAGGVFGLLAGGILVQLLSWHWIFFVNVPVGVLTLIATRVVPDDRGIGLHRGADAPGAVLVVAALMLAVYTLAEAGTHGWASAHTLGLGAVAVALLAAFIARQARAAKPLTPLRLFGSRTRNVANLAHMTLFAGMFGLFFLGALYMQRVLHYDAIEIGLAFLPFGLAAMAMSLLVTDRSILRFGPRATALAGLVLAAAGLLWFSRVPVDGHYLPDLLPVMVLVGAAAGLTCPALFTLGMAGATPEDSGLASGVANTATQYGSALGLAVLATLASDHTDQLRAGGDSLPSALTGGYHLAFTIGAGLVIAGIALALLLLRDPRPAHADQDAQPATAPTTDGSRDRAGSPTASLPPEACSPATVQTCTTAA